MGCGGRKAGGLPRALCIRRRDVLSTFANPKAGRPESGEALSFLANRPINLLRRAAIEPARAEWIGNGR